MPIGPKGPPQKPGLSIRGRVIFDTVRGSPRVRPWPPKKPTTPGSKRNLTAKAFGAANRACKITTSVFYGEHWAATRGTPLLPRDLMIAMMYGRAFALTLEDGRIIRSMASRNDVSTSLDMITQTEGAFLVRGPKYWEARTDIEKGYSGAALKRTTDVTSWDLTSPQPVPYNQVLHDAGGWTTGRSGAHVLRVPAGVQKAIIQCSFRLTSVSETAFSRGWVNGPGGGIQGYGAYFSAPTTSGFVTINISTAPLDVAEGEEYWLQAHSQDASVTLEAMFASFSMWRIH